MARSIPGASEESEVVPGVKIGDDGVGVIGDDGVGVEASTDTRLL